MANASSAPKTSPKVRVSFPTVFKPRMFAGQQGDPKYSITMMFDKNNQEQMGFLREVMKDLETALAQQWPDEAVRPRTPLVGETRSPIKDGDKTVNTNGIPLVEKNAEYAGHYILRASSTNKPVVVDANGQDIIDSNEIYGGCFCKVNFTTYAFTSPQNKGVTFGLNGVQKVEDGESFGGGRMSKEDMFGAPGQNNPANYGGGLESSPAPDPLAG